MSIHSQSFLIAWGNKKNNLNFRLDGDGCNNVKAQYHFNSLLIYNHSDSYEISFMKKISRIESNWKHLNLKLFFWLIMHGAFLVKHIEYKSNIKSNLSNLRNWGRYNEYQYWLSVYFFPLCSMSNNQN